MFRDRRIVFGAAFVVSMLAQWLLAMLVMGVEGPVAEGYLEELKLLVYLSALFGLMQRGQSRAFAC